MLYAALTATIAALAVSFLFSRSVVAPVLAMSHATQRITDGRYDECLQVLGGDELAQLAARFNQMAERPDQVESMRRRLIGDVSHELRTPLTAINGSTEGLMDGVLPANEETFQQIHAEADRLNHLVDDLQELSRVEARAYQLDLRPFDVSPLAQTVTKRLAPQAQSKRISLDLDLTPDIPPEHLSHIFDRFYRVDKSRSRQAGGGSGIGLTIARALVEALGGRIWVESAGEGRGNTFNFTLPVAK